MTDGDLGITLFFGILGVIALFTDHAIVGGIFVAIAAVMIGMAIGKDPSNFK